MKEIFENIPVIPYEGPKSKKTLAFKFYDANRTVMGKPMRHGGQILRRGKGHHGTRQSQGGRRL